MRLFHKHVFDEWEVDTDTGMRILDSYTNAFIGTRRVIVQKRTCTECGFTEFNKQEVKFSVR